MRSFAATQRFLSDVREGKLKPAYVFVGDERFLRKQCREAVLELVPSDLRDLGLYEFDLGETELAEVLDHARTPSLMAPFQVFFISGVKNLYGHGTRPEAFRPLRDYVANPNPAAVVLFIADHISIPADARRMELTDQERYKRIRETLGQYCGIVELARVPENEAVRWVVDRGASEGVQVDGEAARELVDALGGDMMLIANELEKLVLWAGTSQRITPKDVEMMVVAAKQRSLYELTGAISAGEQVRALEVLQAMLSTGEGEEAAIGHVYMLAKTFRQMLIVVEKNVRDARGIWQVLWPGFRVPPFVADDLIRQAHRYASRHDLVGALRRLAHADLELRSNPTSKRMVLEQLVLDLTSVSSAATEKL